MNEPFIGRSLPRVDGYAKVTGSARYAAEHDRPNQAYAALAGSTIGLGRIVSIDDKEAAALPGVLAILTHLNAARLPYREHRTGIDPAIGERLHVLQDDQVRFFGQPVAVVIAETIEQARHAASVLKIHYEEKTPVVRIDAPEAQAVVPEAALKPGGRIQADRSRGDPDGALAGRRADRRPVRDPAREPQSDRDARHDRGLGRRPPDAVGQDASGWSQRRPTRSPPCSAFRREHPRHLALRRRRLRLRPAHLAACDAGGARRARTWSGRSR